MSEEIARNTNKFQKIFLSWNYLNMCAKSQNSLKVVPDLKVLPDAFPTLQEYIRSFEVLILEECGCQILHGSPEAEQSPHPAVVQSTKNQEDFVHVKLLMDAQHVEHYKTDDLILISTSNPVEKDPVLHALALVQHKDENNFLVLRLFLNESFQKGVESDEIRVRHIKDLISQKNSCWWLLRLCALVTITREWNALHRAHMIKPLKQIMHSQHVSNQKGGCKKSLRKFDSLPEGMKSKIQQSLNQSQLEALDAAIGSEELVLIQGPPGTGKTSTILSLLAILLCEQQQEVVPEYRSTILSQKEVLQNWYQQCPWLTNSDPRDLVDPMATDTDVDDDCFGLLKDSSIVPVVIGEEATKKTMVLVCAPSNSALDEILMRVLQGGLIDGQGDVWTPQVVRVGQARSKQVARVHLDELVKQKMQQQQQTVSLQDQLFRRSERGRLRQTVLEEADIIFSTLSYCGSGVFTRMTKKFDIVIIDEAAQAVEPSVLVPLVLGCKKVILVGDPVQLPATVISARAAQFGYDQSLFKRLYFNGYPTQMLRIQYRMHPAISTFPAHQFYNGMLEDGPFVIEENSRPWHQYKCFGPIAFFNLQGKEELGDSGVSIYNTQEASFIIQLFKEMITKFPNLPQTASVAFITPYRAQVEFVKKCLRQEFGEQILDWTDVNSIDGFQGREKDLVIFSAVRSGQRRSIGFVADERRLNVAITRARSSLLIVGSIDTLMKDENWKLLIRNTKARRCLYNVNFPFPEYIKDLVAGFVQPIEPSEEDIRLQTSRDYIPRMEIEDAYMDPERRGS